MNKVHPYRVMERVDGEWVEVPVMRLTPRDLAVLLDRLQVLFDRPARISEGRDLGVSSQIPIDALSSGVWRSGRGVGSRGTSLVLDEGWPK